MSYLRFEYLADSKSGKTRVYEVQSMIGDALGLIRWYAPWRKYIFGAFSETIFDATCLHEIADKLAELTAAQKEGKA